MRLPRSVSAKELIKALELVGYQVTRQTGSHIRLTCMHPTQHHVTIPYHTSIRVGTLAAILSEVSEHLNISRNELVFQLFGERE
jgi:predicted RNA binding protein YcfA (HicA-like mRNA interferase family)